MSIAPSPSLPTHRRPPRRDRRLSMEQARFIRSSPLTGPEMVWLLRYIYGIQMSTVAIWKIRHNHIYRDDSPDQP